MQLVETKRKLNFEDKTFLITGAGGMIGKTIVESLLKYGKCSKIYVADLSEEIIWTNFRKCDVCFFDLNTEELSKINSIDYIIHLASPTNSDFFINKPVETIDSIFSLTKKVLDLSIYFHSKLLYISSMEAYGFVSTSKSTDENKLGFISLDSVRSSYPEAKRIAELLCKSYASEYNVNVNIARLAQTFGSTTNLEKDKRIFAYVANCIKNNKDIELATDGKSFANYCYISDTIRALFYILKYGEPSETYNVSNKNCYISIKNMCKKIISIFIYYMIN